MERNRRLLDAQRACNGGYFFVAIEQDEYIQFDEVQVGSPPAGNVA